MLSHHQCYNQFDIAAAQKKNKAADEARMFMEVHKAQRKRQMGETGMASERERPLDRCFGMHVSVLFLEL